MEESGKDSKLEETQMAESVAVEVSVKEETVIDENSESLEETPDGIENSEKLVGNKVDLDPVSETEPGEDTKQIKIEESLSEVNGVSTPVIDSVSKGIGSVSDQNGVYPVLTDQASKGIEPALDENHEVPPEESSGAVDVVSRELDADNGGGDSNIPEVPYSTENQAYVAVTPRPLQRASWRDCCGLFEFLRRSAQ